MKDLLIVGAGGFGREILQWVKDINKSEKIWNILGFLDDKTSALCDIECDYQIIGAIKTWIPKENEHFVIAIANPSTKEMITKNLEGRGAKFVSIIHPTAIISEFSKLGHGVVVYPYAKINVNATIGNFVSLLGSTIGHDGNVGDYSTITGNCSINGHAIIGKSVFVGSHSVVAPGKKVGDGAYIGNGSVVINNVQAGAKVFGNPARKIDF